MKEGKSFLNSSSVCEIVALLHLASWWASLRKTGLSPATSQLWLCFHSMWQPLRRSHKSHSMDPKAKISFLLSRGHTNPSSVKEVIQTEGQGVLTTLEPNGFLPWALQACSRWLPSKFDDADGQAYVLSHRSNEEEDTLSPPAPHKETKMKILSCPTWETQLLSPEERGSPSVRWLSKIIGASDWYNWNSLSSLTGSLEMHSSPWFCPFRSNSSEVKPNILICYPR